MNGVDKGLLERLGKAVGLRLDAVVDSATQLPHDVAPTGKAVTDLPADIAEQVRCHCRSAGRQTECRHPESQRDPARTQSGVHAPYFAILHH